MIRQKTYFKMPVTSSLQNKVRVKMQGRVVNLEQAKLLIKVQTHNNNSNEEEGGGIRQLQDSLIGKTSSALFSPLLHFGLLPSLYSRTCNNIIELYCTFPNPIS